MEHECDICGEEVVPAVREPFATEKHFTCGKLTCLHEAQSRELGLRPGVATKPSRPEAAR